MSSAAPASGTISANKRIVRDYLDRLSSKGQDSAAELCTPEATWWIQGNWPLGGTFHKQQLIEALAAVTGRFRSLRFDIRHVTAEDNRVSVDMAAHGEVSYGSPYRNTYHLLFFLDEQSRITHVKEFTDTKYANEFFYPAQDTDPAAEAGG